MEKITDKDKLYHFAVCLISAILHPMFSAGLALGKEYGDSKAKGNHWCWLDLAADGIGLILGISIRTLILYYVGFSQYIYL